MKKIKKLFALVAVAVLGLFTLASCGSSAGKIQKAFEKNDYTVVVKQVEEKDSVLKSVYTAKKGIKISVFFELGTTDDLEASIKELQKNEDYKNLVALFGNDAKVVVEKLNEKGLVNGNCILLSLDVDAMKIFKEA